MHQSVNRASKWRYVSRRYISDSAIFGSHLECTNGNPARPRNASSVYFVIYNQHPRRAMQIIPHFRMLPSTVSRMNQLNYFTSPYLKYCGYFLGDTQFVPFFTPREVKYLLLKRGIRRTLLFHSFIFRWFIGEAPCCFPSFYGTAAQHSLDQGFGPYFTASK